LLEKAYKNGRRIKFLYYFTTDFSGFSVGAVWDDLQVGMRYLRLLEACAVVTDIEWISKSTQITGFLMPCPVKALTTTELQSAIGWLSSSERSHAVDARMQVVSHFEPKF
jgi:hypothetical protein